MVVADGCPVFLCGLISILRSEQDFDVVASCCNGIESLQAIRGGLLVNRQREQHTPRQRIQKTSVARTLAAGPELQPTLAANQRTSF